jgi:carboxymethylenebutenolidase
VADQLLNQSLLNIHMGSQIQLVATDGHTSTAYLSQPEGKPKGAVVILQEIFGVNSHIQSVADLYAQEGYLAVAPDMFSRAAAGTQLGYSPDDVKQGALLKAKVEALGGLASLDIRAAVDHVRNVGKVGIVGFCWGGLMSWRTACSPVGISAAVCYYGGGIASQAEICKTPLVPVMAHFGEQDHLIPMADVDSIEAAHPKVMVYRYASGHGFNCDQRASFDVASATQAGRRTLDFFEKHLRQ